MAYCLKTKNYTTFWKVRKNKEYYQKIYDAVVPFQKLLSDEVVCDNTELYEKYRAECIKEFEPATKKVHVDDKFVPKEYDTELANWS